MKPKDKPRKMRKQRRNKNRRRVVKTSIRFIVWEYLTDDAYGNHAKLDLR